jgi:hypothetical protein
VSLEPGPRRFWRELPLWYLWLSTFSLLNLELNVLGAPRAGALFGFLPAFSLVTLAWYRSAGPRRPVAYWLASGLLLLIILAGWTGVPADLATLRLLFEIAALALFAILAVHAALCAGHRVFLLIFGTGLVYGIFLENVGVAARVFSESGYFLYLPGLPAPLCTALGWCSVWYALWWLSFRLVEPGASATARALVALGAALALDLQLDPAATRAGFWVWNPLLPEAVRGVPVINFNAWIAAVWPFSRRTFHALEGAGSPALRVLARLPAVLLEAFVLLAALTLVTEASAGWPSLQIVRGLF